jgi:hypothetical protein
MFGSWFIEGSSTIILRVLVSAIFSKGVLAFRRSAGELHKIHGRIQVVA